jgi:hypothetical protein
VFLDVLANWAMKNAVSPHPCSADDVRAFFIALLGKAEREEDAEWARLASRVLGETR